MVAPSYPLTLRIEGRRVLVVGGGTVASRRVAALVERGAEVAVVAPWACPPIREAAAAGRLTWEAREFRESDLDGAWLVHTATAHREVDDAVLRAAEDRRVWCVKGGDPEAATAWVPATGSVDDVLVAVNAGRDPRRAARLRDRIVAALRAGDLPLRRHRRGHRGWVALVGGGPGADGLLTTRGRRLLGEADVVVVDRLAPRGVLAELDDDVLVVDVGKTAGSHPVPQERINALLVEHALAGRGVVRLKGGDPYVFGRGGEELEACRRAGVETEVVPGVTSAVAVPAAVGIPVTHRGLARGFAVLTAHDDAGELPVDPALTVVLLMGVSRLGAACEDFVRSGRAPETPVAVIEDGYGPRQRVTVGTLRTIAGRAVAAGVRPPAVTVIGDVVTLCPAWRDTAGGGPS